MSSLDQIRVRHLASTDLDSPSLFTLLVLLYTFLVTTSFQILKTHGQIGHSSRWSSFAREGSQTSTAPHKDLIMPTESVVPPPTPPSQSTNFDFPSTNPAILKCALCGVSGFASSSSSPQRENQGIVLLNDPIERLCGGCVRAQDIRRSMEEAVAEEGDQLALGLGLRNVRLSSDSAGSSIHTGDGLSSGEDAVMEEPSIPAEPAPRPMSDNPASAVEPIPAWTSDSPQPMRAPERSPMEKQDDSIPIRILEVCKSRMDNRGKGALYPGSIFKGTQTSGRSAYEVEVKNAVRTPISQMRVS